MWGRLLHTLTLLPVLPSPTLPFPRFIVITTYTVSFRFVALGVLDFFLLVYREVSNAGLS